MKKKSIKTLIAGIVTIIAMGLLVGCGGNDTSNSDNSSDSNTEKAITIKISGSTSVGPLMEKEAEAYKEENSNATVEVQQIGSSAGIKNVIEGVSEIGMASRELKDAEKSEVTETIIAYDGIALVVHPSNKVENLTMKQIKGIYTGAITNWKEVGGNDAPIVVVSREDGSGTRDAFQEIIGYKSEELDKKAMIGEGNGSVKTTVSTNKNAIGYISFEQLNSSVKDLKVAGVEATPEKVLGKEYKLSRPFVVVYKDGNITEGGKKFIDYILGDKGQEIVEQSGGIKIK